MPGHVGEGNGIDLAEVKVGVAGGGLATLSPRQREIVALVARGLTDDEIAAAAAISRNTVKRRLPLGAILREQ